METITELFTSDPLRSFSREADKLEIPQRFGELLGASPDDRIFGALSLFVHERPFRYWNKDQVIAAIDLLERDIKRSISSMSVRSLSIDRGLSALYRQSSTASLEQSLNLNQPRDLITLATTYLPDYLRWSEHVFGNILELFWGALKKGGPEGSFNLKGASALIKSRGAEFLLLGYSDEVRNAIAHGEFSISPFEIQFGTKHPLKMASFEYMSTYDDLVRTCNALTIATLIFWSKYHAQAHSNQSPPINLLARLAAGGFDRLGLRLVGAIESDTPLAGKQLHVAIELSLKKRPQVLGECARVAYHLLSLGAGGYDRYVIQVDQGEAVGSMVTIDPSILKSLISKDAPFEQLSEALGDTNLLWFDEGSWTTRLKSWKEIISTGYRWFRIEVLQRWHEGGIFLGKGRYRVREVENLSTEGIGRVRIRAVLRSPADSHEREIVNAVISDIVSKYRKKIIRSRSELLDPGFAVPKFPTYVWVDLFREDGTLHWLKSGGWVSGNLVAVGESIRGKNPTILIEEPEATYKGIRIRYSMNVRRAAEASAQLEKVVQDILQKKRDTGIT